MCEPCSDISKIGGICEVGSDMSCRNYHYIYNLEVNDERSNRCAKKENSKIFSIR